MRLSTGSYSFHRLLEATRIALRQAPAPQRASPRDFALRIALRKAPVPQRASTRSSECPYFGDPVEGRKNIALIRRSLAKLGIP